MLNSFAISPHEFSYWATPLIQNSSLSYLNGKKKHIEGSRARCEQIGLLHFLTAKKMITPSAMATINMINIRMQIFFLALLWNKQSQKVGSILLKTKWIIVETYRISSRLPQLTISLFNIIISSLYIRTDIIWRCKRKENIQNKWKPFFNNS